MRLVERIAYERTFSLRERWERRKERIAMFVSWHCLPRRVCMWVVVRAHAALTTGENGHRHPCDVKAFELQSYYGPRR